MRFIRHLMQFLRQFTEFAWQNKLWWMIPVVLALLLMALLVAATQTAAPFIYPLF